MDIKYDEKHSRMVNNMSPHDLYTWDSHIHPITNSEIRSGIHKDNLLAPGDIEPFPNDPILGEKWNVQKDLSNLPEELKGYNTRMRFDKGLLRSRIYFPGDINPNDNNNPYVRSLIGDYRINADDNAIMQDIRERKVIHTANQIGRMNAREREVKRRNFKNVGEDVFNRQPAAAAMYAYTHNKSGIPIIPPKSIGYNPASAIKTHFQNTMENRDQTMSQTQPSHHLFNDPGRSVSRLNLPKMAPTRADTAQLAQAKDKFGNIIPRRGDVGSSGNVSYWRPQDVVDAEAAANARRGEVQYAIPKSRAAVPEATTGGGFGLF